MRFTLRLLSIVLCLSLSQSSLFSQKGFTKLCFPKNKTAKWLMGHWGKVSNVKTLKKFNKKFDGENDIEEPQWNYEARKDKIFVKLNSEEKEDGKSYYDGLYIERADGGYPSVTFAGSTTKSEVLKKMSTAKGFEIVDDSEEVIAMLFHPMKVFVKVEFQRRSTQGIYSIRVSEQGYGEYYKKVAIKSLEEASKEMLTATDMRFNKWAVSILPEQLRQFDTKAKDKYQIVNIRYEGALKNGLPQGAAKWGIFDGDFCPRNLDASGFIFTAKGNFENGKPVGEHKVKIERKTMLYTYEAGWLKKVQEEGEKFYTVFKEDGSIDKVGAMAVKYGDKKGLLYYGKVDKDKKPHDGAGVVYFDENTKVMAEFEHGQPKKETDAYFTHIYDDVVLTAHANEKLEMTGKVGIRGRKKNNNYSGFVYLRNGQADLSKEGQLTLENFELSNDIRGQLQVSGKIQIKDFGKRLFEGKNLKFFFTDHPDTRFKGGLKANAYSVVPSGWHTIVEYKNDVAQDSLKGKYAPSGEFLEGYNFYQKKKAWIYDSGYYTDNRNGRKYLYKTIIKENGALITWMLEDIHFEDYTNEVWSYGSGYNSRKKCYYSQRNSKIACPSGWRLPSIEDVDYIKDQNTQDKKWITDNTTLISILSLHRNGYVWEKYRGTEMYQSEEGVYFWLNNGKYISISKLNQGSYSGLDAEDRYHTCRCVKDGEVKR